MEDVCKYFMEQNKPKNLHPRSPNNEIILAEKKLDKILVNIQQAGIKTDKITVFEFYNRISILEETYKKHKYNGSNK